MYRCGWSMVNGSSAADMSRVIKQQLGKKMVFVLWDSGACVYRSIMVTIPPEGLDVILESNIGVWRQFIREQEGDTRRGFASSFSHSAPSDLRSLLGKQVEFEGEFEEVGSVATLSVEVEADRWDAAEDRLDPVIDELDPFHETVDNLERNDVTNEEESGSSAPSTLQMDNLGTFSFDPLCASELAAESDEFMPLDRSGSADLIPPQVGHSDKDILSQDPRLLDVTLKVCESYWCHSLRDVSAIMASLDTHQMKTIDGPITTHVLR
eukprot:GHVH01017510.1.p1 GENE.GHVH01017510.1~~GHVH01017510.1.p1  ORF type:complete len:266 (+),score=47.07 GHVH01017510.1:695-1492(+)